MFFIFLTALCQDLTGIGHGCLDLLTHEEKPCTTMRTGMVRHTSDDDHLQICTNKQWKPYHSPLSNDNRVPGLIGHWKMDEQAGNNVADDSGYEHHGSASGPAPRLSKFSYGRYFNSNGVITIPNTPALNFGFSSFSVCGWLKIVDVKYPLTTYAVKKANGCYYNPGRAGWTPGWETGHGYRSDSLHVCIRDKENRVAQKRIQLDSGYQPAQLIGKWVHYTVVFDREHQKRAFVYVNGKKQSDSLDISHVGGSVNNSKNLELGTLYGWKTKGTLDEYRIYNKALNEHEVDLIYNNHRA